MSPCHARGRSFTTPLSGVAGALVIMMSFAMTMHASAPPPAQRRPEATSRHVSASASDVPMSFEANLGQTDERVKFLARGQGYSLFLTPTEAVLACVAPRAPAHAAAVVRMRLVGANTHPQLTGLDPLPGTSNYFIGDDPARWQRDVPNYARVKYAGVYPGIDLVYYGNQRQLEYDLVVAPGADPARIALAFEGVQKLSLDAHGNLVLQTSHGDIVQHKPVIYQDIGGTRAASGWALRAARRTTAWASRSPAMTRRRPLVIDPVLAYSTYLGGNGNDIGHAIAVDSAGNAYVTGETASTNFPGAGASSIQPCRIGERRRVRHQAQRRGQRAGLQHVSGRKRRGHWLRHRRGQRGQRVRDGRDRFPHRAWAWQHPLSHRSGPCSRPTAWAATLRHQDQRRGQRPGVQHVSGRQRDRAGATASPWTGPAMPMSRARPIRVNGPRWISDVRAVSVAERRQLSTPSSPSSTPQAAPWSTARIWAAPAANTASTAAPSPWTATATRTSAARRPRRIFRARARARSRRSTAAESLTASSSSSTPRAARCSTAPTWVAAAMTR